MKQATVKRFLALALCAAVILGCGCLAPAAKVSAAEKDSRIYETYERDAFESLIGAKAAPQKAGYLFAGWVKNDTHEAILSASDVGEADTIYAKFIPAQLAGVACQISAGTYNGDEVAKTETQLRVISAVDDGVYRFFGFNVYERMNAGMDNEAEEDLCWCRYTGTFQQNPLESKTRYTGLIVYDTDGSQKSVKKPVDVFGADAEGYYFTTARLTGITPEYYDSSIFIIQPYWVTADGTYVEGLREFNRVSDGKNGIVNITINIKDARAIAAGMLKVSYEADSFAFEGADRGSVFEEMKFQDNGNGTISCIGNVADMRANAKDPNNAFVNLRFTKKANTVAAGAASFTVDPDSIDFCNKDEQTVTALMIDDVQY